MGGYVTYEYEIQDWMKVINSTKLSRLIHREIGSQLSISMLAIDDKRNRIVFFFEEALTFEQKTQLDEAIERLETEKPFTYKFEIDIESVKKSIETQFGKNVLDLTSSLPFNVSIDLDSELSTEEQERLTVLLQNPQFWLEKVILRS